jgi:hypothetical protein
MRIVCVSTEWDAAFDRQTDALGQPNGIPPLSCSAERHKFFAADPGEKAIGSQLCRC